MNFWQCTTAVYKVKLQAVDTVRFPAYKGSTIDGALDTALHSTICRRREEEYENCFCGLTCPYLAVFEPQYLHQNSCDDRLSRYTKTPRPYTIEPPLERKQIYRPSDILSFRILLFGKGVRYLPWLIIALQTLEVKGIGSGRGKVKLLEVQSLHPISGRQKPMYHHEEGVLPSDSLLIYPDEIYQKATEFQANQVTLEFLTHTRIRHRGQWIRHPHFVPLFLAIDRRARLLSTFYGEEVGAIDSMLPNAQTVGVKSGEVRWYDWDRYSRRQRKELKLGGFVGRVTYTGEKLAQFMPHLLVGELIHVGKTHFGMGKYVVHRESRSQEVGHA